MNKNSSSSSVSTSSLSAIDDEKTVIQNNATLLKNYPLLENLRNTSVVLSGVEKEPIENLPFEQQVIDLCFQYFKHVGPNDNDEEASNQIMYIIVFFAVCNIQPLIQYLNSHPQIVNLLLNVRASESLADQVLSRLFIVRPSLSEGLENRLVEKCVEEQDIMNYACCIHFAVHGYSKENEPLVKKLFKHCVENGQVMSDKVVVTSIGLLAFNYAKLLKQNNDFEKPAIHLIHAKIKEMVKYLVAEDASVFFAGLKILLPIVEGLVGLLNILHLYLDELLYVQEQEPNVQQQDEKQKQVNWKTLMSRLATISSYFPLNYGNKIRVAEKWKSIFNKMGHDKKQEFFEYFAKYTTLPKRPVIAKLNVDKVFNELLECVKSMGMKISHNRFARSLIVITSQ